MWCAVAVLRPVQPISTAARPEEAEATYTFDAEPGTSGTGTRGVAFQAHLIARFRR